MARGQGQTERLPIVAKEFGQLRICNCITLGVRGLCTVCLSSGKDIHGETCTNCGGNGRCPHLDDENITHDV